jgi:hypothetical protein
MMQPDKSLPCGADLPRRLAMPSRSFQRRLVASKQREGGSAWRRREPGEGPSEPGASVVFAIGASRGPGR